MPKLDLYLELQEISVPSTETSASGQFDPSQNGKVFSATKLCIPVPTKWRHGPICRVKETFVKFYNKKFQGDEKCGSLCATDMHLEDEQGNEILNEGIISFTVKHKQRIVVAFGAPKKRVNTSKSLNRSYDKWSKLEREIEAEETAEERQEFYHRNDFKDQAEVSEQNAMAQARRFITTSQIFSRNIQRRWKKTDMETFISWPHTKKDEVVGTAKALFIREHVAKMKDAQGLTVDDRLRYLGYLIDDPESWKSDSRIITEVSKLFDIVSNNQDFEEAESKMMDTLLDDIIGNANVDERPDGVLKKVRKYHPEWREISSSWLTNLRTMWLTVLTSCMMDAIQFTIDIDKKKAPLQMGARGQETGLHDGSGQALTPNVSPNAIFQGVLDSLTEEEKNLVKKAKTSFSELTTEEKERHSSLQKKIVSLIAESRESNAKKSSGERSKCTPEETGGSEMSAPKNLTADSLRDLLYTGKIDMVEYKKLSQSVV